MKMNPLNPDLKSKKGFKKKLCAFAFVGTWIVGLVVGCYFAYQVRTLDQEQFH